MELHEPAIDFKAERYNIYNNDCLKRLRKDLTNARRRHVVRRINDVFGYKRALDSQNQLFLIDQALQQIRRAFNKLDKIEKSYQKEKADLKKLPIDKTAGRNMLLPRLGR